MVTGHQPAVLDRLLERPGEKRDWEFLFFFFQERLRASEDSTVDPTAKF